ncbi:hypothetical protein GCM10028832_03330 [Streptomyces sparsus]
MLAGPYEDHGVGSEDAQVLGDPVERVGQPLDPRQASGGNQARRGAGHHSRSKSALRGVERPEVQYAGGDGNTENLHKSCLSRGDRRAAHQENTAANGQTAVVNRAT